MISRLNSFLRALPATVCVAASFLLVAQSEPLCAQQPQEGELIALPPVESPADSARNELADLRKRVAELEKAETDRREAAATNAKPEKADDEKGDEKPSSAKEGDKAETTKDAKKDAVGDKKKSDKDAGKDKDKAKDDGKKEPKFVAFEPWADMSQDKWTVKLGGHVQTDYINWADASPSIVGSQDYFEFRRLRLVADGTGYGMFDFRLQATMESESLEDIPAGTPSFPLVKDAYFSVNEIPGLGRFRIGNFFVPFGLEQVTNDTMNIFMERSIPTQGIFTADRQVGMALYNCTDDQRITWTTGAFFDSISESTKQRIDDNQGVRVSGRLTCVPWYDEPSNGRYLWHLGCGVLYTNDQNNSVRLRARPQIHLGPRLVDTGALAADDYTTANLETALVLGRFTAQSEAYVSSLNRLNGDHNTFYGEYIHFSYFLTGENRVYERFGQHGAQFGRNVPFSNTFFTPAGSSWGAWELKGRWSNLNLNDVSAGQYNDFTFGCNWYWSDRTRIMFDWIHPFTTADARFGAVQADILATRFDFNW